MLKSISNFIFRYYPSPIISTRYRDSVYVEIGHTIINILADFRNYSYSLPQIRGLTIHMEEKITTVSIPVNRYDQVSKINIHIESKCKHYFICCRLLNH